MTSTENSTPKGSLDAKRQCLTVAKDKVFASNGKPISDAKWEQFLGMLGTGVPVRTCLSNLGIPAIRYNGRMSHDPQFAETVERIKLGVANKLWPEEVLDEVLHELAYASVNRPLSTILDDRGLRRDEFFGQVMNSPALRARYDRACAIQAETWREEFIKTAFDSSNDLLPDGRPNTAAIQRNKLMIEVLSKMTKLHAPARFNEKPVTDSETDQSDAALQHKLNNALKRVNNNNVS